MESLIISLIISFITTILITPYFKRFLEGIGIIAMDVQKKKKPLMATSGGLPVGFSFLFGLFSYIFITTFITKASINLSLLLASSTSILIVTLLGLLDDINIRKPTMNDKGEVDLRVGLKQWQKAIIPLFAAIPLMAIQAGNSIISIPFINQVNFGLIYPLIIIPLIIGFTSNATNMLAGMNGLESGLGFVLLSFTGVYSILYGTIEGGVISLILAASLLAFLKYNWFPAKFLPGDSLTYLIGIVFGSSIIIGNIEKFGVIAFTPWFIEFLLKARKKFKASSLGVLQRDGSLKTKYNKTYSLTHIAMRLVKREDKVTKLLISVELFFCIIAFIIARITI